MANKEDIQKAERAEMAAGRAYIDNIDSGQGEGWTGHQTAFRQAIAATDAARSPLPTSDEFVARSAQLFHTSLTQCQVHKLIWADCLRWQAQRECDVMREDELLGFADELEARASA